MQVFLPVSLLSGRSSDDGERSSSLLPSRYQDLSTFFLLGKFPVSNLELISKNFLEQLPFSVRFFKIVAFSLVCEVSRAQSMDTTFESLEVTFDGNVGFEGRWFLQDESNGVSRSQYYALSTELEVLLMWNGGTDRFAARTFARWDSGDTARTGYDLREALWTHSSTHWETNVGIGRVFWGVLESNHLVDIINQTDLVESPDQDEKLGQPMLMLSYFKFGGTVELYALPYFRERTFPGGNGRFGIPLGRSSNGYFIEYSRTKQIFDFSARFSRDFDTWGFALSYFDGTAREPNIQSSDSELAALYPEIGQIGLEVELFIDALTFKSEAIDRRDDREHFQAFAFGFEHTHYGFLSSNADLGLIYEVSFDTRGNEARTVFQNDSFFGLRAELNDPSSTRFVAGVVVDHDNGSQYWTMEATRRLGKSYVFSLDIQVLNSISSRDKALQAVERDSYFRIEAKRYFD